MITITSIDKLTEFVNTARVIWTEELQRPIPDDMLAAWIAAFSAGKTGDDMRANLRASAEDIEKHKVPPPPAYVDPSGIPLQQLARIRGSMWTARCNVPFGPRANQDDNILAMDYYEHYSPDDRKKMIAAYKAHGYTHAVTGPMVDPGGYHGSYPMAPNVPTQADWEFYLDAMQEWWDAGIVPIHFIHPDGWTLEQTQALAPLYQQERAQKLLRVVVPSGWEPAEYNWSSETWAAFAQWGHQILPNALILLHTQCDKDAPAGTDDRGDDNGKGNDRAWRNVAPHIHGWLVQNGPYASAPDANPTLANNFAGLWRNDAEKSYANRFHGGYAGWPTGSLWGPNTPIKLYAAEQTSYEAFWHNLPEASSVAWGDLAIRSGADGFLDGGTIDVP